MATEVGSRPPKDALAYWKSRAPVTPKQFETLSGQARSRAFVVGRLTRQDQVNEVYAALTAALEKGETLASFKKRLAPLMKKKGWTGKNAWRVENIYRTNMQSAYQAGRYAQMKKTVQGRPFWRYVAVGDARTRPTHLALHGKVYSHDHDFWGKWYPPNGYMCRCTVQTLSQRQVEKRGYEVGERLPSMIEPVDPSTGVVMPAVPLRPDPGWSGNIGKDWLGGLSPSELDKPLKNLPAKMIQKKAGRPPALKDLHKRHILPVEPQDILPKELAPETYVKAFMGEFGLDDINASTIHTLPGDIPVVIDKQFFVDKATGALKVTRAGRERYVRLLARTIISPYEIWMVPAEAANRITTTLRLIRLFGTPDRQYGGFAVFNLVGGRRWSGATVFTPGTGRRNVQAQTRAMLRYLERQRQGTLVFREK